MNKILFGSFLIALLPAVQAAEMDHEKMGHEKMDHSKMNHQKMADDKKVTLPILEKLAVMPASGKAREGGADGRYVMESISVSDSLASQCAKASRGLVMLDNVAWTKCGGKPKGAAMTPASLVSNMVSNSASNKGMPKASDEHAGHQMP